VTKFFELHLKDGAVDYKGVSNCIVEAETETLARSFVCGIQSDGIWLYESKAYCAELALLGDLRIVSKSIN
jgi:hypothetical protein